MGRRRGWILGWLPLGWEALLAKVWWQSLQELLDSSGCLVICNTFLIQAAPGRTLLLKLVLGRFSGAQIEPFFECVFPDDTCHVIKLRKGGMDRMTLEAHFGRHGIWIVLMGALDLGAWREYGCGHKECSLWYL